MTEKEFKQKMVKTLEFLWTVTHIHNTLDGNHVYLNKADAYKDGLVWIEEMKEHLSKSKTFKPPTVQEIEQWAKDHNYQVNAQDFWEFYENKGWKIGKTKMKSWEMALSRACREGWCLVAGTSKAISAHKCNFCRTKPADGKSKDNSGQPYHWCRVCQPRKWKISQARTI